MTEKQFQGFNLTLEILIVDRRQGKRQGKRPSRRFNLTLEILIVDRGLLERSR